MYVPSCVPMLPVAPHASRQSPSPTLTIPVTPTAGTVHIWFFAPAEHAPMRTSDEGALMSSTARQPVPSALTSSDAVGTGVGAGVGAGGGAGVVPDVVQRCVAAPVQTCSVMRVLPLLSVTV